MSQRGDDLNIASRVAMYGEPRQRTGKHTVPRSLIVMFKVFGFCRSVGNDFGYRAHIAKPLLRNQSKDGKIH